MYLTQHQTAQGPRWARDSYWLPQGFRLSFWLGLPREILVSSLAALPTEEAAQEPLLPPLEPHQEVWASGVTYARSREARERESEERDVYTKIYEAERPELFFKAIGWRVKGHLQPVRIREDSPWNVPEPELVLVVNRQREVIGYCAGNDLSSRSIEGANPLYLPQAKVYDGSCALGPGILLAQAEDLRALPIHLTIRRAGEQVFQGETSTAQITRSFEELTAYLGRELSFPAGVFLMTGTGIVPPDTFTLQPGDRVEIRVGTLHLANEITHSHEREYFSL
jgi:2-dehydro-3-deoxy-D-arabinonate dehydratase